MAENTLREVERLVEQLSNAEQVQLFRYLADRVTQKPLPPSTLQAEKSVSVGEEAWEELFRVGAQLTTSEQVDTPTLTMTLTAMRR